MNFGELPFQRLSGNSEWAPFWAPKGLPNGAKRRLSSPFCATKPAPNHPSSYFPDSLSRETVWKLRKGSITGSHEPAEQDKRAPFGRFALPENARSDPRSEFPDSLWNRYSRKFISSM